MIGVLPMAKKRPGKSKDAVKERREVSNVRCYFEQAELINELARAAMCNVAEAVEKFLDGPIKEILRTVYADKMKRFN